MTIGSHTRTHVLMTNESRQRVMDEVVGSREEIEEETGDEAFNISPIPAELFNTASVNAVAARGIGLATPAAPTGTPSIPLLTVPRTVLWENSCRDSRGLFSGSILNCQIHRAFDLVSGCRQPHTTGQESEWQRLASL